jgi:hypothetical protein
MIAYKTTLVKVSAKNTSKTCHTCGYVNPKVILGVEKWKCPVCSSEHHRDIKTIIGGNKETINTFIQMLEKELKLEEESPLINQIIETHKTIEYDIAVEALKKLLQELKYK